MTTPKLFEGYSPRECGEHRTVGTHRAWCHECAEWCYPELPCKGCPLPTLRGPATARPETHSEAHSAPVPPAAAATDDSAGEPHEAVSGAPRAQESASQRLRRAADLIEQRAALGPPLAAILRTEANTAAGDLPPGVTRVVTATSVHAQTVADLILAGETL